MGYERYPRNASGSYDDRDQPHGYRRDYGTDASRDRYGAARESQPWGAYDAFDQRDRYDESGTGERSTRYRRDGGFQGQDQGYAQSRYGARDYGRTDHYGNRDRAQFDRQSRQPQGYDYDERGFFDRAGDEVRSWFGDEEASRRRDFDARFDEQRHGNSSDDHYGNWRRTQIAALDRDYDEYRRENRTKFDSEFGSWRTQRQSQRSSLSKVEEHMEVVGSDGEHVGTVDKVRGDRIILTKSDGNAGGRHHSIPSRWIQTVDDKVTISKTADQAKAEWRDEERNQAFFNADGSHKDQQDTDQPHVLGRSFSGTY